MIHTLVGAPAEASPPFDPSESRRSLPRERPLVDAVSEKGD